MQTSDIIASIALLVSFLSAGFSWKSAIEANKSRTQTLAQELAPHFINVGYLWNVVLGNGGRREEINDGERSLEFLRKRLHHDEALISSLRNIEEWSSEASGPLFMTLGGVEIESPVYDIPSEAFQAKKVYDERIREYLRKL